MILVKQVVSWQPSFYWRWLYRRFLADRWQYRIFPQQRWLLKQIKTLRPRSILEAGCGFGRNLNFLIKQGIKPEILTGVDISPLLLKQIRLPKSVRIIQANVLQLPFSSNRFDLVFTHGLLMHLPPSQIHLALSELVRVTHHYLVVIEETRKKPGRINHFTWAHDYPKLIAAFNLKILDYQYHGKHNLVWYLLQKT